MTAPRPDDPLARARALTRVLDSAVRVPGTGIRFGLDALIGLIPGVGDLSGAALAAYHVMLASRLGVPRSVLMRMVGNVAVDMIGGTVPVIGDLFDIGWKASTKNLALLERAVAAPQPTARASKLAVAGTVAVIALLGVAGIALAVFVGRAIAYALFN